MTKQKKSWGRIVLKTLMWIVIALIVAIIAIYYYLGHIVKAAINQYVPQITGTTSAVEHVDLSLLSGQVEIRGLKIGNPKGYGKENIFELGQIKILFQPKTVLNDKIIIDSLVIADTHVSAELKNIKSFDSNISDIQKNVESYLGTGKQTSSTKKTEKVESKKQANTKSAGKKVVIKDLKINGTEVSLGVSGQTMTIPLPDIQQKNIGEGKKSKSVGEIVAGILDLISTETIKTITKQASEITKQALKDATNMLKNGSESVEDTAKETFKSLKGLFK